MNHLSISQIRMFRRCPKQWEFRYIKGLKIPPKSALTLGKSIHKGIEHNFSQKIKTRQDLPLNEVLDAYSTTFESLKYETEWEEGEKPSEIKDEGVELMSLHHSQRAPQIQPVACEEKIEIPFKNVDYTLLGYLDVIDEKEKVIDTKTASRTPPQDQIKKDEQLTAYALLYRVKYGRAEKGIELNYLVRTKEPKVVILEGWRTQADIDIFLEEVGKIYAAIEAGIFYRTEPTNWWCSERFCGYYERCMKDRNKKIYA